MRSPAGLPMLPPARHPITICPPMLPPARHPITIWPWRVWMVWVVVVVVLGVARSVHGQFGPQCEEIKIPMCRRMPYNLTRLPNLLHHSTQENAQLAIEQFELLRWTKCSDQLEFFLCAMYAPICTVGFLSEAIPPCRSVCQAARQGCEPLLAKFHIPWPTSLECEVLPVYDRGVCITPQAIISPDVSPEPVPKQVSCQCREPRLLRRRIYNSAGFHYGLRGRVISVESFGELTLTTVCVQKVAVGGGVLLVPGREAHLWTNRSCACPPLTPSQDYLILGWEDRANSRLLYLDGSIALPFRKKYLRKIKAWEGLKGGPHNVTTPHSLARTPSTRGHNNTPSRKTRRKSRRRRRKKRRRKNKNGQRRRKVTAEREGRTKTCRLRNGGA